MSILDRYLGRAVILGSLFTLLVLSSLVMFFEFINELRSLSGGYGIWEAAQFVFFLLPGRAYELLPTSVLLGALLSLGALAGNHELIVIRAAGLSIGKITLSVMKAGLLLMLLAIFLGEFVAPLAEQYAQTRRVQAQSGTFSVSRQGFWARDGQRFISIGRVMPDLRVQDVKIYNFDDMHKLHSILSAKEGEYGNGVWNLRQVEDVRFEGNGFTRTTLEHRTWESLIHPETLESLAVSPNFLPMPALYQYITYLQDNRLDASRYELAFWIKLVKPFSALIMLLIAMPFVFGPLRSVGVGQRLLVGILLGLGFHLFNQALNYTVLGYGLNPLISALLPSLFFTVGGVLAIRKLR